MITVFSCHSCFAGQYSCIESFTYVCYHQLLQPCKCKKRSVIFIITFANFSLKTRLAKLAFTVSTNIFIVVQNILKNILENLFSNISVLYSVYDTVSNFSPQNCIFTEQISTELCQKTTNQNLAIEMNNEVTTIVLKELPKF